MYQYFNHYNPKCPYRGETTLREAPKNCGGMLQYNSQEARFRHAVAAVVFKSLSGRNFNRDRKWARLVMERDDKQCKVCGGKENLHAHHIFPRDKYPVLRHKIDNGLTLCRGCHAKWHVIRRQMRREDKDCQLVSQAIGY